MSRTAVVLLGAYAAITAIGAAAWIALGPALLLELLPATCL
jgi:hypothetical protein